MVDAPGMTMATAGQPRPVQVGDRAPDFRLPAAQGGEVALSDYRGRRHVLLVFLNGSSTSSSSGSSIRTCAILSWRRAGCTGCRC